MDSTDTDIALRATKDCRDQWSAKVAVLIAHLLAKSIYAGLHEIAEALRLRR